MKQKRDIFVFVESRFPVKRKIIRSAMDKLLDKYRIRGKVEIEVLFVGNRKIKKLNKQFAGKNEPTTVLSFPLQGEIGEKEKFIYPPQQDILRLGAIVISFPEARVRAAEEEKLLDQKIEELLEHGLRNLLGLKNSQFL